jgi:hypothetical protein
MPTQIYTRKMTEQQKKQMLEDDKITFEWFFDEDEFIVPVKLTLWQRIKNRLSTLIEWI